MSQFFRTHRMFQLLSWIDGLSRGYQAPDNEPQSADDLPINDPHRPPTASNLAYYLLTDAEYNKDALEDRFWRWSLRGTPDKEVFEYVKGDLTRHLTQYPGDLFMIPSVRKTPVDHPTFEAGLESRQVKANGYYLTKRGRDRLVNLKETMQFKDDLMTTQTVHIDPTKSPSFKKGTHILDDDAVDRINGNVDPEAIQMDSLKIPVEQRSKWKTKTYWLPHVDVVDSTRDQAPTVYRD